MSHISASSRNSPTSRMQCISCHCTAKNAKILMFTAFALAIIGGGIAIGYGYTHTLGYADIQPGINLIYLGGGITFVGLAGMAILAVRTYLDHGKDEKKTDPITEAQAEAFQEEDRIEALRQEAMQIQPYEGEINETFLQEALHKNQATYAYQNNGLRAVVIKNDDGELKVLGWNMHSFLDCHRVNIKDYRFIDTYLQPGQSFFRELAKGTLLSVFYPLSDINPGQPILSVPIEAEEKGNWELELKRRYGIIQNPLKVKSFIVEGPNQVALTIERN